MRNGNRNGRISITSKNKVVTKMTVVYIILAIILAVVTGVISAKYAIGDIKSTYNKGFTGKENIALTENNIRTIISKVGPSLVTIGGSSKDLENKTMSENNITGAVVSDSGLIITSYEEIKKFKDIYVKHSGKGVKPEKGVLLGYDSETDIALIKINSKDIRPIEMSEDGKVKTGQLVLTLGNSTADTYIGITTPGIVTATNHLVETDNGIYRIIQTNAVMNSENYGGVLSDIEGRVIGINSKHFTKLFDDKELYFAVGTEAIKASIDSILKTSDVLGIKGSEVTDGDGFYVTEVENEGSACKSGIKPTDIILSINGTKTNTVEDFYNEIKDVKKGNVLKGEILRDGKKINVNIKIQ